MNLAKEESRRYMDELNKKIIKTSTIERIQKLQNEIICGAALSTECDKFQDFRDFIDHRFDKLKKDLQLYNLEITVNSENSENEKTDS